LCFSIFLFFIFNFQLLKGLLQKMLNYRLGTVNENHWGFKPVFLVIFGENSHLNDIVCTIAKKKYISKYVYFTFQITTKPKKVKKSISNHTN